MDLRLAIQNCPLDGIMMICNFHYALGYLNAPPMIPKTTSPCLVMEYYQLNWHLFHTTSIIHRLSSGTSARATAAATIV